MTAIPGTAAAAHLYFEDVQVGERAETPALTVTETHVQLYRGLTGDDPVAPGLIPDVLPLCLSTGLGWRLPRAPLVVLAFMGIEWRVVKPLRVGATIRSRSRTAVKRAMREAGVVVEEHDIVDHHGDVVQQGRFTFLVARRPVPAS